LLGGHIVAEVIEDRQRLDDVGIEVTGQAERAERVIVMDTAP